MDIMDRLTFGKKTLNTQRGKEDRFVAPRGLLPEFSRRMFWGTRGEQLENTGEIWFAKYLQQKKYMRYLDEAFDLEPLTMQGTKNLKECHENVRQTWPCVPRKKSYLTTADSILDLPTYGSAAFPELLDWSNDDVLVAALGRNYHKWSWGTQSLTSQGYTLNKIQCCKFDPSGSLLLLGTNPRLVEIHDNEQSKRMYTSYCQCMKINQALCSITAIDWSPTGNLFVMGCSRGVISAITRKSERVRERHVFPDTILVVKVSPDSRFVAAASLYSEEVLVLSWPGLQLIYSKIISKSIIKTLNWHPWRSALLNIGALKHNMQSSLILWDIPSSSMCRSDLGRGAYSLDALQFSHRTGEMVVSLWNSDLSLTSSKECSQLVVMSDINTVVDQWGEGRTGLNRVRTMVFSPDGTKLATATADEDLIIWNFLPEENSTKKKKKNIKRFCSMPQYLDFVTYGFSIR